MEVLVAEKDRADARPPPPLEQSEPAAGLTREEREHVREAVPDRAPVHYEIIRLQGETELRRPASALWWSGVVAGMSIGLSFLSQAALTSYLPAAEWTPLVARLGYAVGFLVVILGHQQLFTENVLTAVLPVMSRWQLSWLGRMLRLWGLVLAANVVGCTVFALFFAQLPVVSSEVSAEMGKIVEHLMQNAPEDMFIKGIGAGWMIAALVWILSASEGVEFLAITVLTYLIALFGFTHVVAGSCEAIYGYLIGMISLEDAVVGFFLPTLAGNVFGGTVLFSVLCYAQVREEIVAVGRDD